MSITVYDYAVVGGGCAGFQLLYQLAQQPNWINQNVLLLADDKPLKRSWCFWSRDSQPPFHDLLEKSWSSITFRSAGFSRTESIAPYRYHYLAGDAFFRYFYDHFLPSHPNITHVTTTVDIIARQTDEFLVAGSGQTWRARQVFSSQLPPLPLNATVHLLQHFSGWFVKMNRPVFDEQTATLMDFTVPQEGVVQFGYVLPFSTTEALVEITVFSPSVYTEQHYTELLTGYLEANFPNTSYTIDDTEHGQIPMTDFAFSRYGPSSEILIGTAAGMVKASTGYAFRRIGADSVQLAQCMAINPSVTSSISWPATRGRFWFYDRLLLGIIAEQPVVGVDIFLQLFKHGSFPDILQFMDEESSLLTEMKLISRLPYTPFLTQLFRQWLR